MTITLGDMLRHRKIKQSSVLDTLKNKYGVSISQSCLHHMCNKEGDWFSKKAGNIQECIRKEYGIYYDGVVWRGGEIHGTYRNS